MRSEAGRVTVGSRCGHDRINPRVDHGPLPGRVADGGVGSGTVSEVGTGTGGERSANRTICGIVAARNWVGESTTNLEESLRDGMSTSTSIEQIVASYDDAAPLAEASTIPAPWYVDARIAELERQTVFSRTWQVMGRVDQVEMPGQFVTATVAGEPLVAVRGNDGVLRAFYNGCRHHAAAVVTEPCGQSSVLRFPYHGWNYGSGWRLKGMPEFDGVKNFERKDNGLGPVKVDTWETLVFVNLDPRAASLQDFLGRLVKRAAPLELS